MEFLSFLEKDANKQLEESLAIMKKINSEMSSIAEKRKSISTPSSSDNANKKLIEDNEKLKTAIAGLQKQIDKLNDSKRRNNETSKQSNQKTQEEITNGRILAQNANKQALAVSALAGAYVNLTSKRDQARQKLLNLIASEKASTSEIHKARIAFDALQKKVQDADRAVGKFSGTTRGLRGFAGGVSSLMGAFGISTGVYLGAQIVKDIYQTTKELQSLDLALKMVSETQQRYISNTVFVKEVSEQWGVEIKGLTEQFTQFYVNAKGKLSDAKIKESFEGIAKAGSLMGISVDKQNDAFYAFNQMLSKGTVQAEELKKQLGNALPGAIKAATMAYQELHPELKVTEQMMLDQMKAGNLISSEMVPAIIRAYQKLYGIENINKVETLAAAQNRLSNSWVEMVRSMNESETGGISNFFKVILDGLSDIIKFVQWLNSNGPIPQKLFETKLGEGQDYINKWIESRQKVIKQEEVLAEVKLKQSYAQEQYNKYMEEAKRKEAVIAMFRKQIGSAQNLGAGAYTGTTEGIAALKNLEEQKIKLQEASRQAGFYYGVLRGIDEFLNPEKAKAPDEKEKKQKQLKEQLNLQYSIILSEYELKKAILERQKAEIKDFMNDERTSFEAKIKARQEYSKKIIELLDLEYKKDRDLLKEKLDKETLENNEFFKESEKRNEYNKKNGLISEEKYIAEKKRYTSQYAENIKDIATNNNNDLLKLDEIYLTEHNQLIQEDYEFYKSIEEKKKDIHEKYIKQKDANEKEYYKKRSEDEKLTLQQRQFAFQEYLRVARAELQLQKIKERANAKNAEDQEYITEKYNNLEKQLNELKSPIDEVRKSTEQWLNTFANTIISDALDDMGLSALKMFADFDEAGQTTFEKMMIASQKTKTQLQTSFLAISEVVQNAFNMMQQNSQAYFDGLRNSVEQSYRISYEFSDKSDVAERKLQDEKERRLREIQKKEFKQKQNLTMANIAMDIAQALVGLWVKPGFPEAIPMMSVVGGIGLAQLGMVKSQKMPEYENGTPFGGHGGGLMKINDAKGSNYQEIVKTPDGKLGMFKGRNVVVNAPKGTEVFTAEESMRMLMFDQDLNNLLSNNNIVMPKIEIQSQKIDFSPVVKAIENQPVIIPDFDKLKTTIKRGNTLQTIQYNHTSFQSNKI